MDATLPPICVLVGGRGTRLGTLTDDVPKPLIEVAGRPFIEWPLMRLRDAGFRKAVLCTGYKDDQFPRALGDGAQLGMALSYSSDGPQPLGTLGAIRHALPYLGDPIPVMYGDTLLHAPFDEVVRHHQRRRAAATMTVLRNAGEGDTSNAVVTGEAVTSYAKDPPPAGAEWIDYGFLVLDRRAVAASDEIDLAPLLEGLTREGRVAAFPVTEAFREIGTPASLAATDSWIRSRHHLR